MKRLFFAVAAAFAMAAFPVSGVTTLPSENHGGSLRVADAATQLQTGAQPLDLRSKGEWDKGHLTGAKQISLADENFTEKAKATLDPAKPVLVYCRSGRCSGKAAKQLRDAGFSRVDELEGGIEAWETAGKPVEK